MIPGGTIISQCVLSFLCVFSDVNCSAALFILKKELQHQASACGQSRHTNFSPGTIFSLKSSSFQASSSHLPPGFSL